MRVPIQTLHARSVDSGIIRQMIESVREDVQDIEQFYNCNISPTRVHRLREYFQEKLDQLDAVNFDHPGLEDQTDFVLLQKYINQQLQDLDAFETSRQELAPLLEPFASYLINLLERRQKVIPTTGRYAADVLSSACISMQERRRQIACGDLSMDGHGGRFAAYRAANDLDAIRDLLEEWSAFYKGYDPTFTWWISAPCKEALDGLEQLGDTVRDKLVGRSEDSSADIVGQPTGRAGLLASLDNQIIAYSPEELIKIAEKEYAWCEREMIKASKELGYGVDWKAALEHVKNMYVEPGQQTQLVHELAEEAVAYVKQHDMVTIPPIAEECWRTFMMSPERQKVNPFFLGGESIIVSYPTDSMPHADKLMSMRGNNRPMSRSTVFHELIPGHHLQMHMIARYRSYRSLFTSAFWIEGWAFYWEFILWDRGFAGTPEEKIGMLFWRMHRCARIVFSLKFHLGEMTPQECIDYLVDKVGHERATAEGEVRRSFNGEYSPLYQAGYMLGALQFYAMRKEMVEGGTMSEKQFHDRVLREGEMPIEILRALMQGRKLQPGHKACWRFYDL